MVVERVEPGSQAAEAGLQRGDVIVEIDRHPIKDTRSYEQEIARLKEGESALLLVIRQGRALFMTIGTP